MSNVQKALPIGFEGLDPTSEMKSAAYASRLSLLQKLTDLVVMPVGIMSINERAFTADILISTLEGVTETIRYETAKRLAGFADMPLPLLRFLAADEISVAEIILQQVTYISESILIGVAMKSPEHRALIVARDDVTSAVADVLLRYDEQNVIIQLLRNERIQLNEAAMDKLVLRSQNDHKTRDLLLSRPELRMEHGFAMFWWMETRRRKTILSRFAADRSVIQEALHECFRENFTSDNPDPLVRKILTLVDRRHRPRGKNGEMVTMDVVELTLKAARLNPSDEFAHAVGLLAGVSSEVAKRVLLDASGEAFAILCKSIGIGRNEYKDLYLNSFDEAENGEIFDEEKVEELQGIFDSISRDYSRTILRYWDWRSDLLLQSAMIMPVDSFGVDDKLTSEAEGYFGAI